MDINNMESKLAFYIALPDFTDAEGKNNQKVTMLIAGNKNKEAYDILYKMLKDNDDNDYENKKTRYILIRIAHLYIYSKMWEEAINTFIDVMEYSNSVGNPLLHLRIGQIGLELDEQKIYEDNLARALIMGGLKIFENEDNKLKEIAVNLLKPPPEGWDKYDGQDWSDNK